VKSLAIQGVPVGGSSLFYYEPTSIPAPIPYGVTPVILTNPLNSTGSNLWTPEVGDTLEFNFESQLSSSSAGNTVDFNLLYDSASLITSNFNLLNLVNTLSPAGGLSYSGTIYCSQKTLNGGNYDYTFVSSLRVKASTNPILLNYQNETSFTTPNVNGLIEMSLSAQSPGEILLTNFTVKKIN
jgi:hypothetical protein